MKQKISGQFDSTIKHHPKEYSIDIVQQKLHIWILHHNVAPFTFNCYEGDAYM